MNIKLSCTFALVAACMISLANAKGKTENVRPSPEKVQEGQMRIFGGFIPDRRKQSGLVYVVNSQAEADSNLVDSALARFTELVHVDFKRVQGEFSFPNPRIQGEATLFLVDMPEFPMSMVAPESRWALMNVAPLKSEKKAFFEARVKKETFRVLSYLLGVAGSKYQQCITGCVTKAEDLDDILEVKMPLEFEQRFERYLPGLGIVPWEKVSYKKACQEGWAPAPTNEYQKAIWDKVHTIPTNPLKIEFDPKKGR